MRFSLLLLIFLFACNQQHEKTASNNLKVTDDLGVEFSFEKIPQKVITLAPNLTEFIYALNLEDKLIANTVYCNYPDEAKNKTKVGDMISVDYEKIVNLNPDLIFITVEGNAKESYEKLKSLGYKIFVSNPRNYEGIKKTLKDIAFIFNKNDLADSIISDWDRKYEKVISEGKLRTEKKAMFAVSITPLMLCGENTFMNEFLVGCGLQNIAAGSPMNYPVFNREKLLLIDPEIMIFTYENDFSIDNLLDVYPEWKNLKAIKNNGVLTVDPDLYFRPGPRFLTALIELNKKIGEVLNNR